MWAYWACYILSKFHFMLPFSLFFHFQFPIQAAQVTVFVPLIGIVPIYMLHQAYVISPFYPCSSPNTLVYCRHLLGQESVHCLLAVCEWVQSHYLLTVGRALSLSLLHYSSHDKFYSILGKITSTVITSLSLSLSLATRMVRPHVPFCLFLLACIIWSQPVVTRFGKDAFPAKHLPKEVLVG